MVLKFMEVIDLLTVCEEIKEMKMPVKLGLIIAKNISALKAEREFYIEQERDFAMKYLEVDEMGNFTQLQDGVFKIKEGLEIECRDARIALDNFETEVNLRKIPYNLIENMDCFTPGQLEILEPILDLGEEE